MFTGGQSEALPHAVPRRAEEHGENSPVCGSQTKRGRVRRRVRKREQSQREESYWSAGCWSKGWFMKTLPIAFAIVFLSFEFGSLMMFPKMCEVKVI